MKNRIKEDNYGFTLVEIVVTIVVLAIITVPLLSYFTDSVRHSARTKQQQNAVVLAQNTLEELKISGQDLSDPNAVLATPDPAVTPDPAAATLIPWNKIADKPLPAPVDGFYPPYYLYRTVEENGRSYLVQIKVEPKHDLTNTDASGATRTEVYEKVTMPAINSSTDVILQEDSTSYNEAVRQFYTRHTNAGGSLDKDEIAKNIRRSIRLVFREDAGEANNIEIIVYYNYRYNVSDTGLTGSNAYYQVSVKRASIPGTDLRNVFIFFEPDQYGDRLQFGPEYADDPNTETSTDFNTLKSTRGLTEGQVSLFLVAQNSAPAGEGGGTVKERSSGYKFTVGSAMANDTNLIFKRTTAAGTIEETIFTNLLFSEVTNSGTGLDNLFFTKTNAAGNKEYTLLRKDKVDRIAEVEVSVFRDIGDGEDTLKNEKQKLTTVNGAVVLNK